jgi:hypothetical protein
MLCSLSILTRVTFADFKRLTGWCPNLKFSVRPLCSLRLCGECLLNINHHGDIEDTKLSQRRLKLGHYR